MKILMKAANFQNWEAIKKIILDGTTVGLWVNQHLNCTTHKRCICLSGDHYQIQLQWLCEYWIGLWSNRNDSTFIGIKVFLHHFDGRVKICHLRNEKATRRIYSWMYSQSNKKQNFPYFFVTKLLQREKQGNSIRQDLCLF